MKEDTWNNIVMFLAFVVTLALIAFGFGYIGDLSEKPDRSIDVIYPSSAVVVATDITTDTVILNDGQNTWVLRGVEDWEVGDCVSMIMSTNGTREIEDDVIVKARFSALTVKGE